MASPLAHALYYERKASDTYRSILDTLGVAIWHSQIGVTPVSGGADVWTDQIGGRLLQPLTALNRPPYAADGTVAASKPAIQCATTGALQLQGSAMTTLAAAGTRPYTLSRVRMRSAGGGIGGHFPNILCMGAAATDSFNVFNNTGGAGSTTNFNMTAGVTGPVGDTSIHTIECWGDGTNLNIAVDGVITSTASAATIATSSTSLSIAAALSAVAFTCSDSSHWLHLFASAYPGAIKSAQLRALAAVEFPA
jgi:hypothetical protein